MKRNRLFVALLAAIFSLSLCFGIVGHGVDPVAADEAAATTHTLYKARALIEGGSADWIWFSNNGDKTWPTQPLGSYKKVRIILAASRADIVREIFVNLDSEDHKRFGYDKWDLDLKPGEKNVIELDLSQLSPSNGATADDLATHVISSIEFLIHTDKPGAQGVTTYLTAGIQLVGEDDSNADFDEIEYDPIEKSETHTFFKATGEIEGGHASDWIWVTNFGSPVPNGAKLSDYRKVRIILAATRATMITEINVKFTGEGGNAVINVSGLELNMYRNDIEKTLAEIHWNNEGKTIEEFIPTGLEFLIRTKDDSGYSAEVKTNLTAGIQFVGEDDTNDDFANIEYEEDTFDDPNEIKESIKLLDFNYKGGKDVHEQDGKYVEDKGCLTGTFSSEGGEDGSGSVAIEVTRTCDGENGNRQFWITTGGKWIEHRPASGLTENSKLYFNNFGSIDLSYYTEDSKYIENILITFGTEETSYTGATLKKTLTDFSGTGWQHIRFNIDSMVPTNFDFEKKLEFVSLEIVITVRAGTPIGSVIRFDDLKLNTERCDPVVAKKDDFALEYTTGEEVDLTASVDATHPFGDKLAISYGVKYSAEEGGESAPVKVTDGKFTPYRTGYYYVTVTATDTLGASAIEQFTIVVTGENIDVEAPSISFGTMPSFMAQPGELDLTVIKVTDDVDEAPEVIIEVTDENGNKLTVKDGKVNITAPGVYTVTVTAKDHAEHETTLTRKVTVEGTAVVDPGTSGSGSGEGEGGKGCGKCSGSMGGSLALAFVCLAAAVRKIRR